MWNKTSIAPVLSVVLLAGCVQTPRITIVQSGTLPPEPSSFALAEGADTPVGKALSACLVAHGFSVSGKPAWLVLVTEADRPKAVGALEREIGGRKDKLKWLPGVAPASRPVRSLTFVLMRASTGAEIYRLVVSERYRPDRRNAEPTDLAKAACPILFTSRPSAPLPAAA